MDIYQSLVKDAGGACSIDKLFYIHKNFIIPNKNIKTICEIGVYNGCFILPLAQLNNEIKFYGIDPYISYIQNDIKSETLFNLAKGITLNQPLLDDIYSRLIRNIEKFKLKNVEIIRDYSKNVNIKNIF